MTDFLIEADGESKPADSAHEAEDLILSLLHDGTNLDDIEVSIVIREKLVVEISGVTIKRRNGLSLS